MNKCVERLYNGLVKENPTFVLMSGMCPTLAVTTSAINGVGMGLTTTVVLVMSNMLISMLRKLFRIRLECRHLSLLLRLLLQSYSFFWKGLFRVFMTHSDCTFL